MGLPRDDVVFRLWQCDKENHGWREGPPLTVPCQSFDLLGRAFTLATKSASNEKEYYLAPTGARSSIRTLAGLEDYTSRRRPNRLGGSGGCMGTFVSERLFSRPFC